MPRASASLLVTLAAVGLTTSSACPGTGAGVSMHAHCSLTVVFGQDCDMVQGEMEARLQAAQKGRWLDPHNSGHYNLTSSSKGAGAMTASRVTGSHCEGCYTDKMDYSYEDTDSGGCKLIACSESQSSSYYDESTNYCSMRNLYCNTADGCPPVKHELTYTEDKSTCFNCKLNNCDAKACVDPALVKRTRAMIAQAKGGKGAAATSVSCSDVTPINRDCGSGRRGSMPTRCTPKCAGTYLPWYKKCGAHLGVANSTIKRSLIRLNRNCKKVAGASTATSTALAPGMRQLSTGDVQSWLTFGLWVYDDDTAEKLVNLALSLGVTSFFCSVLGGNQAGAGRAFAKLSAAQRAKLFLIGTVNRCPSSTPEACYVWTKQQAQDNLVQLQQSKLEQLMLDYPPSQGCQNCAFVQAQWRAFMEFQKAGKVKTIAVSNYCPNCLDCIAAMPNTVTPAMNQLLFHVGMGGDPSGMIAENTRRGIPVQAYSPLARGSSALLHGPVTTAIGAAHSKTPAQVAYKWVVQHNVSLCLSSQSRKHFIEDLDLFNWTLTATEMGQLDALSSPGGNPYSSCPNYDPSTYSPPVAASQN